MKQEGILCNSVFLTNSSKFIILSCYNVCLNSIYVINQFYYKVLINNTN